MDYYIDDRHCTKRLLEEHEKYGSIIVCYDYDNTVYDYDKRGNLCSAVIDLLRECKKEGFHLTVFTSCNDDRFPEIKKYLTDHNIPFDSINETPDFIPYKGRKVYYNILLDDRAGLSAAYGILNNLIYSIRGRRVNKNIDDVA